MRVLVVSDHDRIVGGAERFLHELIIEVADSDIGISVLALSDIFTRSSDRPTALDSTRHRWIPEKRRIGILCARIREASPDLIHLNTNARWTATVFSALYRCGLPVVVFVHDDWLHRRICLPGLRRLCCRFQFMTHHAAYHASMQRQGLRSWLVRVPFRSTYWASRSQPVIHPFDLLYVGRLDRRKGLSILLQAVELLVGTLPGLTVAIAGDGAGSGWLTREIAKRQLTAHITLTGHLPDEALAGVYRASRLLVVPSARESLGYVGLEAQSCGLPVVAFANPGTLRWCAEGVSGFPVSDRTPAALARRIAAVLADDTLRARIAGEARAFVQAGRYNASGLRVADAYRAILQPC